MFEGLLQPTHLILILVIVLIIFGPGKLPDLGKALGQGIREFKQGSGDEAEVKPTAPAAPAAPAAPLASTMPAAAAPTTGTNTAVKRAEPAARA